MGTKPTRKPVPPRRAYRLQGKPQGLALLMVALICGSFLAFSGPHRRIEAAPNLTSEGEFVLVPVPARPVARGERLKDVPLTVVKWPKSRNVGQYVSDPKPFEQSVTASPLPQQLPIPVAALTNRRIESNSVVDGIPSHMRAITVRVDNESAVEGWAQSGSSVDVILVRANADGSHRLEATVIAENIRILSAGRVAEPSPVEGVAPQPPATVTLLVTQEDALKIKAAATLGRLTFSLRGVGDSQPTTSTYVHEGMFSTSTAPTRESYRGYARGPDGQRYVLTDRAEWLRSSDMPPEPAVHERPEAWLGTERTEGTEGQH